MVVPLAVFSKSGVAVVNSNPHAGQKTYTFDLLCVITISTSLCLSILPPLLVPNLGLARSIRDLASTACYASMYDPCLCSP